MLSLILYVVGSKPSTDFFQCFCLFVLYACVFVPFCLFISFDLFYYFCLFFVVLLSFNTFNKQQQG